MSVPKFKELLFRVGTLFFCTVLLFSIASGCRSGNNTETAISATPVSVAQGILNLTDIGPYTLDPAAAAESTSGLYIIQLFGGLVRLDENMDMVADIAERWDKSEDGKTFTFHLRKDVRFHDGKSVTAVDFKYSWERALNPATQSKTAGTYLGDIVGATDVLTGSTTELSGVKIIDDYTLEVAIDAPKAYFLAKMAYPTAFVVDRTNVETGSEWWEQPNGTGPFKLRQWERDELLVLQRNSDYYGDKAKIEEVVFKLWQGNSMALYQTDEVDVTYVGAAYMDMVTDKNNPLSRELQAFSELSFFYIGFNTTGPPFDDVNVRRAFSHAVDREKIVRLALSNIVLPAYGVLPPGMPGYNDDLSILHYDPARARKLITASSYGDISNLPPITLTTLGWGGNIGGVMGGVIEEWRRNLGVEVMVRQLEPEVYLYNLREEKDEIYETGWIADYPDPQNFLSTLFHSDAESNVGEYSDTEFDNLLDRAAVEQDTEERLRMYQEAEGLVIRDAVCLPLYFGRSHVLVKPYVKDYVVSPLGQPLLNKVYIEGRP